VPQFRTVDDFIAHLRSNGVRVDVVGHNGSQPTVVECGCTQCRGADQPDMFAPEADAPEAESDDYATIQAINPLADLANALQPGRRITIECFGEGDE
jgi:hypothetical protein